MIITCTHIAPSLFIQGAIDIDVQIDEDTVGSTTLNLAADGRGWTVFGDSPHLWCSESLLREIACQHTERAPEHCLLSSLAATVEAWANSHAEPREAYVG